MLARTILVFISLVMSIVMAITISPETANAKDCKAYTLKDITETQWQCLKGMAESNGFSIKGESGSESKFSCSVKYEHDNLNKKINFTLEKGFGCLLSCSDLKKRAESYLAKASQKCKINTELGQVKK